MSLHQAIGNARIHQTRLLLDIGTDPNTPDKTYRTPLMLACFIDKEHLGLKIAKMLLEKGAKVGTIDRHGRTALSYACMNGRDKIVRILLEDIEYDINLPDELGNTPLMYAAMSGNVTALRYILDILLKYRLSVDLRNDKGFSAYLLAAKMGHFYCAHVLKVEGYASDGIRDTEFFLSDKEWVRKTRKEIERMQLCDSRQGSPLGIRPVSSPVSPPTPRRPPSTPRPQTSFDFHPKSQSSPRFRAVSRLTIRSEPHYLKYNSWTNIAEDRAASRVSRTSSASTATEPGHSLLDYESSNVSGRVPTEVRTKTPDLHAIFSQYLSEEAFRPVKITPYDIKEREVRFAEELAIKAKENALALPPSRQRKQSRMGPNRKRSVFNK